MEKELENVLYSRQVIEFVTVANEYCKFLENIDDYSQENFLSAAQKLLPFIYLKTTLLPNVETVMDEPVEKIISQLDWTLIQGKVCAKLGEYDLFFLMKNPQSLVDDEEIELSVSEVFTDIYQDLADFTQLFRMGNEQKMNDALAECNNSFEQYWGKRLLALLTQLHYIVYEMKDKESTNILPIKNNNTDWFLSEE